MSYDNDDELHAREQYQDLAVEYAKPIGHVLYWQGKGRAIDGNSPIMVLASLKKEVLDDYFLDFSPFVKMFTKSPKIRWPPNARDGHLIPVTEKVMRDMEIMIINGFDHHGEMIVKNQRAVIIALFDFNDDPDNLIIVIGLVPFGQSSELITKICKKKPRLVYEADWMSEDFITSFEDWAQGA